MRVAVAIIWRPTPERERAFRCVVDRYRQILPGAPIITADAGGDGFNRAESRNVAMDACSSFDVVVLSDADCVFADDHMLPAITAQALDGQLHMPFSAQHYCTSIESERIYSGNTSPLPGLEGTGACYVITPSAWAECGGMDPRFGDAWGGEDDALNAAADALIGVVRHGGTVLSLHHADEDRPIGSPSQVRNYTLAARYDAQRHNPDGIRALIAERSN